MAGVIKAYATPWKLFRFRDASGEFFDREIAAIEQGYVFCPAFTELNDPMEGSLREGALLKASGDVATTGAVRDAVAALGIASFSEVRDPEPMWAHYASQFAGICVEYSVKRLLKSLPDGHEMIRMTYSEVPPTLLLSEEPVADRARLVLSTKSIRWAGEREWRLVAPARGAAEYGRIDTVTAVYFGSRITPSLRTDAIKRLHAIRIPLYDMVVEDYALSFRLIERERRRS